MLNLLDLSWLKGLPRSVVGYAARAYHRFTLNGRMHWLWRAGDANGDVFDVVVQSCRNKAAVLCHFRKLFKKWCQTRVIFTDKLRSYGPALSEQAPGIDHRHHNGLNNRAEASHRHTKRREKVMDRFKSLGQAQRIQKAVAKLVKDRDELLAFYDFPAEHWKHIRTTNPIESVFATVRNRTRKTKGCLNRKTALSMVFRLVLSAKKKWRKISAPARLPEVIEGVVFKDGIKQIQIAA